MAALCLLVAALLGLARPVEAAHRPTTSDLRQRAARLAAAITADDAALQQIGLTYLADRHAQQVAQHAQASAEAARRRIAHRVRAERHRVAEAAIVSYVGASSASTLLVYLEDRPDQLDFGETYLAAFANRLSEAVTALERARLALAAAAARDRAAARRAASALQGAQIARNRAIATLTRERQLLATTRGRLAALVAAQAAAAARAAARRRAIALRAAKARAEAAARAAAARAATTTTTTLAPAAPAVATGSSDGATLPLPASGPPAIFPGPSAQVPPSAPGSAIPPPLVADFARLRMCESGDDYAMNDNNGYFGAYQFAEATWLSLGESGLASNAAPAVQDAAAYRLYLRTGWVSWPACSAVLGL